MRLIPGPPPTEPEPPRRRGVSSPHARPALLGGTRPRFMIHWKGGGGGGGRDFPSLLSFVGGGASLASQTSASPRWTARTAGTGPSWTRLLGSKSHCLLDGTCSQGSERSTDALGRLVFSQSAPHPTPPHPAPPVPVGLSARLVTPGEGLRLDPLPPSLTRAKPRRGSSLSSCRDSRRCPAWPMPFSQARRSPAKGRLVPRSPGEGPVPGGGVEAAALPSSLPPCLPPQAGRLSRPPCNAAYLPCRG